MKRREGARLAAALGSVVRAERLRAGLTQEQLAEAAEMHPNYISFVERGLRDPSFAHLVAIATALEIRPQRLVAKTLKALERVRADAK